MNDSSSEQANYNELKFSRKQGFFDNSLAIRWLVAVFFGLTLFFILHFREIAVEVLELNSIAPRYIVSQVDFDFYDEEATIILKQEALRDIGKIFKIDEKEIQQRRIECENFLIYNEEWRKSVQRSTFEGMYKALETLEKSLIELRFTDPRTLQKLREVNISVQNYQIYTPLGINESTILPIHIWANLAEQTFTSGSGIDQDAVDFIMGWFQTKSWTIQEDIPAQGLLGRKLKAQIPEKFTHVKAGSRIIDQGERVNARHVAMLQAMQKTIREKRNLWHPVTLIGSLIMVLLFEGICIVYLHSNHPQILASNRKLLLLTTIIALVFSIAKVTEFFLLGSKSYLFDAGFYPIFVPLAAILVANLINGNIAIFVSGFLTIILAISLVFEPQGFMIINLATAMVAVLSMRSLKQRTDIFIVCAKAWVCSLAVIFALIFYQNTVWDLRIFIELLTSALCMLLTGVLVVGLLPLLESLFKVMTNVTLMESMDPDNPLLRRLSIEAPGTYQHSLVVGNLAEAAAMAIGANGLFCRVSTLYHDIGKIITPQYFTENQQGGVNIHELLTPMESAQVIMAHVTEGVALAKKAGLPEQFIDIIKEHHGTTLVYYFYRKELERLNGDLSQVNEKDFRYQGPCPRSKESAIIMIADSVEAASRSLEQYNEDSLLQMTTRLIREKAQDGQFDQCLLTFEELAIVQSTLVKTLVAYGHSRVKYPTRNDKEVKMSSSVTKVEIA